MLRPMLKSRDRAEANYGGIYKLIYSTKSRIEVYLHVRVVQYPRSCHWSVIGCSQSPDMRSDCIVCQPASA